MKSKLFRFEGQPAYLSIEDDVLLRIAFRIFTWQGQSKDDAYESGGWWHLHSGIIEPPGRLELYEEVTSFGYELADSVEATADIERWVNGDPATLPAQVLELLEYKPNKAPFRWLLPAPHRRLYLPAALAAAH